MRWPVLLNGNTFRTSLSSATAHQQVVQAGPASARDLVQICPTLEFIHKRFFVPDDSCASTHRVNTTPFPRLIAAIKVSLAR
jgi:hypothetical protein